MKQVNIEGKDPISIEGKDPIFYEPKQQSAVEWLIEQLEWDDSKIARVIGLKKYNQVVSQAKEMEKQQSYSEEDMAESFMACWKANVPEGFECKLSFKEWFEQFKKK